MRVLQYLEDVAASTKPTRDDWYRALDPPRASTRIETRLAARPAGRFASAIRPRSPTSASCRRSPTRGASKVPMAPYPRIRAINATCLALPAFDAARPDRQPDAE